MFNPANLAKEIFNILRSYDYTVNIFDFEGNEVYEPDEARRFFASPKNITVSIHEDGENSTVKMFMSKSTTINEVMGLISTLRVTVSKFNVRFNVRKYDRELKPKDLAPNAATEYDGGIPFSPKDDEAVKPVAAPAPEEPEANPEAPADDTTPEQKEKIASIDTGVEHLTDEFGKVIDALKAHKVKENMSNETPALNESEVEMIELPALGCSVELSEWEAFKNGERLTLYSPPEEDSSITDPLLRRLMAIVPKVRADGMAKMLGRVAEALEHGSDSGIVKSIAEKAVELSNAPVEEPVAEAVEPADVWESFLNGSPIVTESVAAFDAWFDSMSGDALLEAPEMEALLRDQGDSDSFSQAMDIAYTTVRDNFSVGDFLDTRGDDFKFGDDTLTGPDKIVEHDHLRASLIHYVQQELEDAVDGSEYPSEEDAAALADDLMPDVIAAVSDAGWTVSAPPEPTDDDGMVEEPVTEGEGDECSCGDDELKPEDVLLPSNPATDFASEVTVDHGEGSDDSMDRILALARGNRAAQGSPLTPR